MQDKDVEVFRSCAHECIGLAYESLLAICSGQSPDGDCTIGDNGRSWTMLKSPSAYEKMLEPFLLLILGLKRSIMYILHRNSVCNCI